MTNIPTPAIFATRKATLAAPVNTAESGTPSRPDVHDGVMRCKHLRPGQVVRAFIKSAARGKERTVESIERLDDGAMIRVSWADGDVTEHKAAYRWFVASLVGTPITGPKSRRLQSAPAPTTIPVAEALSVESRQVLEALAERL